MGRVKKLFELANGKLPSYAGAFVKVRGVSHPLDPFLSGKVRFAKKIGSPLPIWLPDNQTSLSSAAYATDTRLNTTYILSWIQSGSKLLLNGNTFAYVEDILNNGYTLSLADPLSLGYPAGTTVDLYGHPLELDGTFVPSTQSLYVPDDFIRSLEPRESVSAVYTSEGLPLVGEPVIDGVSLVSGDRVLLTGQVTDPTQNGIWVVSVFSWSRPTDFGVGTSASRAHVYCTGGTLYSGTSWICTSTVGLDTIADLYTGTPTPGSPLTWTRMSTVTTFVVHSEYSIYPGDVINYKFFEYDIAEATHTGTLPDGRLTYQVTIDIGIPDTLVDGSTDQVYLRAFPAYESERRSLPKMSVTQTSIGPFLYDRMSGSFFEDLYVEEIDIVSLYTASGDLIMQKKESGKNYLVYNMSVASDSFLFWDLAQGHLNFSGPNNTFVAYTSESGKFHIHFTCVPEIVRTPGFLGWRVQVKPTVDTYMSVQLAPNAVSSRVLLSAGVYSSVNIDFPKGSEDIQQIHVLFDSEVTVGTFNAGARIDMKSWEILGLQTTALVSHTTIAKVTGRNVWASSSAFAKPYWLRLTYLEAQTDLYSRFNGGLLAL